ncbi:MAG TPA: SUMF1/EgtB/PvdO family nonheme iron enzyme [Candidatus Limnocylindrales bacterium]|nr:SUMF1/EgtB/PvdO family nonheme iron enzyme [Candidatus Limnocylindrales bacterium]
MKNPEKISERFGINFDFTVGTAALILGSLNTFIFLSIWAHWGLQVSGIIAYIGLAMIPLLIGIGLLRRVCLRKAKFMKKLLQDTVRRIALRNGGRIKPFDLVTTLGYNSQKALKLLRELAAEDPENIELKLNYDTGEIYFEFQDILKSIEAGRSFEESRRDPRTWVEPPVETKKRGKTGMGVGRYKGRGGEEKPSLRLHTHTPISPHTHTPTLLSTPPSESGFPQLYPFEFDTLTVDPRGKAKGYRRGQGYFFLEDLGNGITLEMVAIPEGTFWMGSPNKEPGRLGEEGPQHLVRVTPFFIGKFTVTQAQWQAIAALPPVNRSLDPEPSRFRGADRPVEQVSWYDCQEFCARLSLKTGRAYRLPSEAEWEYTCRAGTMTPFHVGYTLTTDLANYNGQEPYGEGPLGEYRKETTPVGSFGIANAFGLYDMHGNVWEWCADPWHENYQNAPSDKQIWESEGNNAYRVLRGGSWNSYAWYCRSACRDRYQPDVRHAGNGFRVAVSFIQTSS